MDHCDLCNVELVGGRRYSPDQVKTAVRNGLRPDGAMAELAAAFGQNLDGWAQQVMRDTTDWALCSSCAARLDSYLGSTREAGKATSPTVSPSQGPAPRPPTRAAPAFAAKEVVDAFVRVLTRPAEFWESVRDQTGFGPPVLFAVVMGVAAGVVGAFLSVTGLGGALGGVSGPIGGAIGLVSVVTTPILYAIGCFVGGGILYVVALVAGGEADYERSVRIAGYASAVGPIAMVVAFVPLLGIAPALYGLYLAALGVVALEGSDRRRTFIAAGVLAGILVLFQVVGFFTARSARSAAERLEAQYGAGSQFQRDVQRSSEEMRRVSEEVQKAAEEARKRAER